MKQFLLAVFIILGFSGYAQSDSKKYVDGILYFQLKQNAAYKIPNGSDGRTNMKDFAFLGDMLARYQVTEIQRSFYMAKDEKLLRTFKVFFNNHQSADDFVKELEKQNIVEYAERLPAYKFSYVPNDQYYNYTTTYMGYTLNWKWYLDKINASQAWDISRGSSAIRVAVTDNAIFTTHPDLQSKIVAMRDVADLDNDPNPPATVTGTLAYEWSHGTHVSGLVGAQSDNNIGIASLGFNVSLVAVKIANNSNGSLTAGYEGVTWASTTGQADVINMSWGGPTGGTTAQNVINAAYAQGCVLIAAAGNDGNQGNPTFYPAAYTNCIAVGATNSDDTKADFSEYGTWVDVCAPGGNQLIGGSYFTPLASTTFNNTLGLNTYYGLPNTTFGSGKYDGMQGTSMASPIVAGLAGLILSVNPAMTQAQVRNCIISTADNINSVNASYLGQIGSGRINAYAALQCAQATSSVAPTVSFTGSPLSICPGSTVSFTNTTTSTGATTYTWTFQGGTPATSTQTNVTVTYNTPGVYSVTLAATNAFGSNSTVQTAYVTVTTAAALPLVEGFQSATFPPANWTIVDAGADNKKWALKTTAGQASTQSAFFDNFSDVTNAGYRDQLKTFVNLSGYTSAKMTFYRAYSATFASPNMDSLQIGVSVNCGTSVTSAYLKGGPTFSTAVNTNTNAGFTPTAAQWKKDSIDLTPYVGQSNVMIAFINRGHYGDNLYLDNINITGTTGASPVAAISSASTGCTGSAITLTDASTGSPSSWTWSMPGGTPASATSQNTSVTYATAGVKTISLTVANGSGTTTATKTITITAGPTLTASPTSTTICSGNAVTVNVNGATTYTWLPSGSGTSSSLSPTSTTVYTITGSNGSCNGAAALVTINVTTTPTVAVSASSTTICTGQSTTLTASGATTYAWFPGGVSTATMNVNPTSTTVYTVTGTNGTCTGRNTIAITLSTAPTVTASVTNTTICSGTPVTVNVGGATSYTWLPSGSGTSSILNPSATTVYSITGSNGSCTSAVRTVTINVGTPLTLGVSASSTALCAGQSAILTATGAATYAWFPGSVSTATMNVNPTSTTVYTVTGTNGSCNASQTITITVNSIPTVTASVTNTTICSGTPVTVNVGGATSYTWLPSGSGTSSILNPSATTVYSITGANGSCTAAVRTVTITVTTTPTVGLSASSSICSGQSATLTASGATSYTWLPSGSGATKIVSPSTTTAYTVTGSNGICVSAPQVTTVSVTATPVLTLSPSSATVCNGSSVALTASGAISYTWSPSGSGSINNVSPSSTTVYTLSGSFGGCVATPVTTTVYVATAPIVGINASSASLCIGQSATLTASGASAYLWQPGAQTASAVVVSPAGTTTYSVTGTTGGCSSGASVTIQVSAPVAASLSNTTICAGTPVTVNVTGGNTYTWSPSGSGATSNLSPTSTTVYTVAGTGSCGTNQVTFTITVLAAPVINASASSTICAGSSTTLSATGANSYNWSPVTGLSGSTGSSVVASPASSLVYTVTGSNGTCSSTQTVSVSVILCVGMEDVASAGMISVYPNPNTGIFTVSAPGNTTKLNIEVMNTLGQSVLKASSKDPEALVVDMNDYSRGVYYLKIQLENGTKLVKVVLE